MPVSSTIIGQHFAYASGRLGALDAQLLSQSDIDRLIGAPSGKEAERMLQDIDFIAEGDGAEDLSFNNLLEASAKLLKTNVEKMAPEEKWFIFNIFWIDADRTRLSYLIKKKKEFVSNIATAPSPPVSIWSDVELEEEFEELFAETFSSPIVIDQTAARACHARKLTWAKESGNSAIARYMRHLIDLENLRTLARDIPDESDKLNYLPGGDIDTDVFVREQQEGSFHFIADEIRHTEYAKYLLPLFEKESSIDALAMEKAIAQALSEELIAMKNETLGPEALFSYTARALHQLQLLRILLIGKLNNLPIQEIKSLLPPLL